MINPEELWPLLDGAGVGKRLRCVFSRQGDVSGNLRELLMFVGAQILSFEAPGAAMPVFLAMQNGKWGDGESEYVITVGPNLPHLSTDLREELDRLLLASLYSIELLPPAA